MQGLKLILVHAREAEYGLSHTPASLLITGAPARGTGRDTGQRTEVCGAARAGTRVLETLGMGVALHLPATELPALLSFGRRCG